MLFCCEHDNDLFGFVKSWAVCLLADTSLSRKSVLYYIIVSHIHMMFRL